MKRYEVKVNHPDFDPNDHPRDRRGRFIEIGAEVRIWGGSTGTVLRNVGGGRLEVHRDSDGKNVTVHRNYLTVVARPDGSAPTTESADAPVAAPVEAVSPEAVHLSADDLRADAAAPTPAPMSLSRDTLTSSVPESDRDTDQEQDMQIAATADAMEAARHAGQLTALDAAAAPLDLYTAEPEDGGDVQPAETVYDYPSWKDEGAISSIETANRRAQKAGVEDRFTYTIEHRTVPIVGSDKDDGVLRYEQRSTLTLNRPTVSHDGWQFAATLTWDAEAGLVTRTVPNAHLAHRPEARKCDVCKSARDRRDTYVVQRAETGEELQVGSNCLTQFMGIRPAGLWMLNFEPDVGGSDNEGGEGRSVEERISSTDLLALGLAVVTEHGWVSRGQASVDMKQTATAERVADILFGKGGKDRDFRYRAEMRSRIPAFTDEAATLLDESRTIEGDNDYVTNLRAVAGPDTVTRQNMALLLSAIAASRVRRERDARDKAEREATASSQHVGAKGDKITGHAARVVGVRTIDGDYGVTTLFTFMDSNGNVMKWFASGNKDDLARIGDDVTLAGTIKGHGEYRGVPETNLTRVKVSPTGDALVEQQRAEAEAKAAAKAEKAALKKAAAEAADPTTPGMKPAPDSGDIPTGTPVRVLVGDDMHQNGLTIYSSDGEVLVQFDAMDLPVNVRYAGIYRHPEGATMRMDRDKVVALGSATPVTVAEAVEAQGDSYSLPGMEKSISTYGAEDQMALLRETYAVGSSIRVRFEGKYINVPVTRILPGDGEGTLGDPPRVEYRLPDGSTASTFPSGITGYIPK